MVSTPASRREAIVEAIVEARRTDGRVVFEADGTGPVTYEDRTLDLRVEGTQRDRLEALLDSYHVFKRQQPATRKAPDGAVVLSAVTDPKHAADFVESLFREVYDAPTGYVLTVEPR